MATCLCKFCRRFGSQPARPIAGRPAVWNAVKGVHLPIRRRTMTHHAEAFVQNHLPEFDPNDILPIPGSAEFLANEQHSFDTTRGGEYHDRSPVDEQRQRKRRRKRKLRQSPESKQQREQFDLRDRLAENSSALLINHGHAVDVIDVSDDVLPLPSTIANIIALNAAETTGATDGRQKARLQRRPADAPDDDEEDFASHDDYDDDDEDDDDDDATMNAAQDGLLIPPSLCDAFEREARRR